MYWMYFLILQNQQMAYYIAIDLASCFELLSTMQMKCKEVCRRITDISQYQE